MKDFTSILASMVNVMRASTRRITDFNVGSVARTLLEAPAIEMDQLYQEMFHGLKEAIPVATYTTFEFGLLPASAATGVLTFYATGGNTTDVLIASGTQARNSTTNKMYQTTRDVILLVGATEISVSAVATEVGSDTNCDAYSILEIIGSITGVAGVSNLTPFTGGSEIETEEARKLRFQAFISTLTRGTTSAILYGAQTSAVTDVNGLVTERVAYVGYIEPYDVDPLLNAPGFVEVYVHNGVGGTSPALVAKVQTVIDGSYDPDGTIVPGWKAAGVVVDCFAATEVPVPVTGAISALDGYQTADILEAATTAVAGYIKGLTIGATVITAEIIERVMAIDGVYNFVLSAPAVTQIAVARSEKAMPGVITLTAA